MKDCALCEIRIYINMLICSLLWDCLEGMLETCGVQMSEVGVVRTGNPGPLYNSFEKDRLFNFERQFLTRQANC